MLDHISNIYDIEQELIEIENYLSITCSENPEEAIQRGNDIVVYMARSGKLLADAKYHQDKAIANSIIKEFGEQAGLSTSILKILVEASCKHENFIVNWCERINRTCAHSLDWLRTIISKAKEEKKYDNMYNHGKT